MAALAAIALLIVVGWTLRHRFVPLDTGSMAPAYSARSIDGREVSLASLRGKVVVFNVWATWCQPCLREMPSLERAYQQLKDEGLEVVAVSVDAPPGGFDSMGNPGGDVRAFASHFGLSFTILHDPKRTVERKFSVFALPTTILIDRSGRIAQRVYGGADWADEQHLRELRKLLAEAP